MTSTLRTLLTRWTLAAALAVTGLPAVAEPPSATFQTLDGESKSVSDYFPPDQWLVLMIWASDCHVCNMEAEAYAYLHEEQEGKTLRLLGLSIDGPANVAEARDFVARHDIPFPNLIGDPMAVAEYYAKVAGRPFQGTPSFVIFRPDGTPAASQAGAVPGEVIVEFVASQSATAQ